jgi:hypothetical protein
VSWKHFLFVIYIATQEYLHQRVIRYLYATVAWSLTLRNNRSTICPGFQPHHVAYRCVQSIQQEKDVQGGLCQEYVNARNSRRSVGGSLSLCLCTINAHSSSAFMTTSCLRHSFSWKIHWILIGLSLLIPFHIWRRRIVLVRIMVPALC